MHFTRFTDYGLRALTYLALAPERLAMISEIAQAYQISEHHMTKVVHRLGQAGLVDTLRGRNGGVRLARPAAEIGIGNVVRALEPEMALADCQAGGNCAIRGPCGLEGILDEAVGALLAVLDRYTLADIASPRHTALRRRLGQMAALPSRV
ncbi:MAG: Rrf2 family transcriptional regulator [Rhodospirillales bacterium]|nr:Rrf2 family transcriptional regulator [Rhodospirillales bacterium]MDE2319524.1 Rrf2 family transcriptional regulator [Rhodospirillales bacterium]